MTWAVCASILMSSVAAAHAQPVVRPADPGYPLYVLAHVDVTPEHVDQALSAIRTYVSATRVQPGAIRIEAMQELRPNHFDIIELWRDQGAYQIHEANPATLRFHDAIAPWRGSPFEERLGRTAP